MQNAQALGNIISSPGEMLEVKSIWRKGNWISYREMLIFTSFSMADIPDHNGDVPVNGTGFIR